MPLSSDEAYDRAARKIWRAFLAAMLLPTPLFLFQAWLRHGDRTRLYLLLGMALFWCAVVLPLFLGYARRSFRARSIRIADTPNFFGFPLILLIRYPSDIIRDCGGAAALEFGAFAAVGALCLLVWCWFRAVDKEYQAALPRETLVPAPVPVPAHPTAPSGPTVI